MSRTRIIGENMEACHFEGMQEAIKKLRPRRVDQK